MRVTSGVSGTPLARGPSLLGSAVPSPAIKCHNAGTDLAQCLGTARTPLTKRSRRIKVIYILCDGTGFPPG